MQEVAQWWETIAYELITNMNQQVKRVYIGDVTALTSNEYGWYRGWPGVKSEL